MNESEPLVLSDAEIEEITFPICSLLPKKETQTTNFLRKHPNFDGRNILIAILDTGVDPAAQGLQVTSIGSSKILNIFDCTGAGDVDTSVVRSSSENGTLIGLTGRKLKIPKSWSNPSGRYHVGVKNLFDLYPTHLRDRIKKERQKKTWDVMHRLCVADITRQLDSHDKEFDSDSSDLLVKWAHEDLKCLAESAKILDENYADFGPVMDCVVFHDGKLWRACIDTSFRGNLGKCKLLGSYGETKDYAQFTEQDLLTYSVNFYDNGKVLEIATPSLAHGTHVASIAAACYPDNPERNGLAPGAQIISFCIGDNRLNGMETGTALTRAINACIEMKVDMINYSFAEASNAVDYGPICKAIEEAVYKHNITFIAAASNNGPALSSVSCPGGTLDACISVGAYASPAMLTALYSMRDQLDAEAVTYSWTSRGPAIDGGLGVDVCAPGAAFTSVPNWTLERCQLQNGTSMSSPNVTGSVACLLSALNYQNLLYSPLSIKRALENTAIKQKDHEYFAAGQGVIQIDDAYEYILANYRHLDSEVRYKVTVGGARGIYLRELYQMDEQQQFLVEVEPIFKEEIDNITKVNFEKHFSLACDCDWIECPTLFTLSNRQRNFTVKLNLSKLADDTVNFSQIVARDSNHPDIGLIWRLPVTVIKPRKLDASSRFTMKMQQVLFKPSVTYRHFIHVPYGAQWADLKFQTFNVENRHRFGFHALQLLPHQTFSSSESHKVVTLPKNGETSLHFSVHSDRTLEMSLAKWWASTGDVLCDFELSFRGLMPLFRSVAMRSSDQIHRVLFQSKLMHEEACPSVFLTHLRKPLKPIKSKLAALHSRDLFQDGRQIYELVLHYDFTIVKSSEIMPDFPPISDYLYENQYNNHLWMVFTKSKQFICAGSAFSDRYTQKLPASDYTLMLQLRSDSKEMLEKSKKMSLVLHYKLSDVIQVDCFSKWSTALEISKKFGTFPMPAGYTAPLYFVAVPTDKLPKMCTTGCSLTGFLTLAKNENAKQVSKYDFSYFLDDLEKNIEEKDGEISLQEIDSLKTVEEKYKDAQRDLNVNWLGRLDGSQAEKMYESMKSEYPDHLPLYQAKIKALVQSGYADNREQIIDLAELILCQIDQTALLVYFGAINHLSSDAEKIRKYNPMYIIKMNARRSALIESLVYKGMCVADYLLQESEDPIPSLFLLKSTDSSAETPSSDKIALCEDLAAEKSDDRCANDDGTSSNDADVSHGQCLTSNDSSTAPSVDEDDRSSTTTLHAQPSPPPSVDYDDCHNHTTTISSVTVASAGKSDDSPSVSPPTSPPSSRSSYKRRDLDEIFIDLMKFCDASDLKVALFCAKHAVVHSHYGRALKFLRNLQKDRSTKELEKIETEIYEKLGWMHVVSNLKNRMLVKYPPAHRLF